MTKQLNYLRHESLLKSIGDYDETLGLIGGYDPSIFTPEILKQRFDLSKFTERSLHSYQISVIFALYLLMLEEDSSYMQLEECRNSPVFNDKAYREKITRRILKVFAETAQDPDGRLKWYWEEPKCCDGNGTFFTVQPLVLIDRFYSEKLPPELRKSISGILKKTYPVFKKETETCSWSYVNPALAAYTFSALLAEKYAPEEYPQRLEEWKKYIHFLRTKGIAENYTTTYLTVDSLLLMTAVLVSNDKTFCTTAVDFLNDVLFKQAAFFGNRFPAPYRRGYNGKYRTKRNDLITYLHGWSDKMPQITRVGIGVPVYALFMKRFDLASIQERKYPRELVLPIHDDCSGFSYLDKKFLIGAFDKYPSTDNIVWQCVTTGGSGWQDGPVYATFENKAETSLSLRLEAVDEKGVFRCHPFEGDFTMEKVRMIYPWRSFPPEPKIRTVLKRNHLLCLTKIDKVDAVLQKLGFSLHFARFNGDLLDMNGKKVTGKTAGPVIVRMDGIHVGIFPLKRVLMKGSNLWECAGYRNDFVIGRKDNSLELMMYNLDEDQPQLYTQNHAFGGFFLMIEPECSTEEFIRKMKAVKISDVSEKNRINAAIDLRDAVRTVSVETENEKLEIRWDHYRND